MEFKEKYLSLSTMLYHYTSLAAQVIFKRKLSDEDVENIKIMTPLTDNPKAPGGYGRTPIYLAALLGLQKVLKSRLL